MERKKLISKIRKLLALGQSPHPAEAAAAMAKAAELMREHGVDERDVAMANVAERIASAGRAYTHAPVWMHALAQCVAGAFQTSTLYAQREGFVFIGVGPAAELSVYAYAVLRRQLTAARAAYFRSTRGKRANRIRRADTYALAWVHAVEQEVRRFAAPAPQIVEQYLAERYPHLVQRAAGRRLKARDFVDVLAGVRDGSRVQLQHAMATPDRAALGA